MEAVKPKRAAKRQRESDNEACLSSPPTPDLFEKGRGVASKVESKETDESVDTIVVPSSGSSSGMDVDSSLIDLTQQ